MFSLDKIRITRMNKVNLTKDKKQYYKDYYKNNKERMLKQGKQYYVDNREEICKNKRGTQNEYYKEYYQAHKDYYKSIQKTDEVKEKHRVAALKSYYKHHEERKERNRLKYHKTKPPPKPRNKLIKIPRTIKKSKTYPRRDKLKSGTIQNAIHKYDLTDDGCVLLRF